MNIIGFELLFMCTESQFVILNEFFIAYLLKRQ